MPAMRCRFRRLACSPEEVRAAVQGLIKYSEKINGTRGNHDMPVRFDKTGRYIGITQWSGGEAVDRVLLSPKQVKELLSFIGVKK